MDRAEKIGLAVAGAGHIVLFGLLSIGFLATPNPLKLEQQPMEVSLAPDVALEQTAPQPAVEPAQSVAPEEGLPEDAAPPAPEEPAPAPEPAPQPAPAPPKPAPPKPALKPAPAPKPAPVPPAKPKPAAAAEKAPAKPAPKAPAKPTRTAAPAKPPTATKGSGATKIATAQKPRGSRLGADFLKGLSPEPSKSRDPNPPAAKIGAQAAANIGSAILRQVQPCANRQVTPGPGAERIRVAIKLRINRDGSLAARPTVVGAPTGVDGENERYVDRVKDLAIATFVGCAPLTGLPKELYDVPGGWSNFTLRYKLPG